MNTCLIAAQSPRAGRETHAFSENCKKPPTNITLPDYPFITSRYINKNNTVSFYSIYAKFLMWLGGIDS